MGVRTGYGLVDIRGTREVIPTLGGTLFPLSIDIWRRLCFYGGQMGSERGFHCVLIFMGHSSHKSARYSLPLNFGEEAPLYREALPSNEPD